MTNEILRQDKFALVENPAVVKFRCHQQAKKRENDTTNIAIIGGGNQDLVKQFLEQKLTSEIFDKEIVVKKPDYGKHIIDSLDPESWVHNSDMDYLFLLQTSLILWRSFQWIGSRLKELTLPWKLIWLQSKQLLKKAIVL